MADLSGLFLTGPDSIIDAYYEANYQSRNRLGLSEIGNECQRYLWYRYNGYCGSVPLGRIIRLMKLGEILEREVIKDLCLVGYNVFDQQNEVVIENDGVKLYGHIDGKISGLLESSKIHLLEIKSSADKYFKQLKKLGSYEEWNVKYKAQIHVYAVLLSLERIFIIVYNKDTSELYCERIKTDKAYAVNIMQKAFESIQSKTPPERICPHEDYYKVKMCTLSSVCFNV